MRAHAVLLSTRLRAAAAVGALAATAACSGSSGSAPSHSSGPAGAGTSASSSASSTASTPASSTAPSSTTSSRPPLAGPANGYYVSVGDSYAAGYQPTGRGTGHTTRNGFAYQVVPAAAAHHRSLQLVNFGCGGATTASMLHTRSCPARALGPGATPYPAQTQAAAAEAFLRAHRGRIALITVSIGGNDIIDCGVSASPVPCLTGALGTVRTNLATIVHGLRAAAGPDAPIIGITYPDVLLGNLLSKNATLRSTAKLSTFAFQSLINPALKAVYESVGGRFVDVTAATGGYGALTSTTTLPPYGTIPVPVARICTLTYYCQYMDIHPRTPGYALIARLVVAALT